MTIYKYEFYIVNFIYVGDSYRLWNSYRLCLFNIKYLFLPFETKAFSPRPELNKMIRIGHAPTDRLYKGSDNIIKVCKKLEKEKIIIAIISREKFFRMICRSYIHHVKESARFCFFSSIFIFAH